MEIYFKLKIFFEFVVPGIIVGIVVLIFIIAFIKACISDIRMNKVVSILKAYGFERQLYDVASMGGGTTYWYVRKNPDGSWANETIFERDLYNWSVKDAKEYVKNLETKNLEEKNAKF